MLYPMYVLPIDAFLLQTDGPPLAHQELMRQGLLRQHNLGTSLFSYRTSGSARSMWTQEASRSPKQASKKPPEGHKHMSPEAAVTRLWALAYRHGDE